MIATPGLSVNFLKKENYSGSHAGMRYYLTASDGVLTAFVYPDIWCFEKTPEKDKRNAEFPFTPEGLEEALAWIDEQEKAGTFRAET